MSFAVIKKQDGKFDVYCITCNQLMQYNIREEWYDCVECNAVITNLAIAQYFLDKEEGK